MEIFMLNSDVTESTYPVQFTSPIFNSGTTLKFALYQYIQEDSLQYIVATLFKVYIYTNNFQNFVVLIRI